jgi:hypothetical protein
MKKSLITKSLYVLVSAAILSSFAFSWANQKTDNNFNSTTSYKLDNITYIVFNDNLRKAFKDVKDQTYLKLGSELSKTIFFNERSRLTKVATQVNPYFREQQLYFLIDTMKTTGKYSVTIKVIDQ